MDKIDNIFFINLLRRPDRHNHFVNEYVKHNLPLEKMVVFEALDGATYAFDETEKKMFRRSDFVRSSRVKFLMGNQLSHFYILKKMIAQNYKNIIIFQDDAIFRDGIVNHIENIINNMPEDAEIINIGYHQYADNEKFVAWDLTKSNDKLYLCNKEVNEYICKLKPQINPCSLAYIVTQKGAMNIVNHFNTNGFKRATDHNYNEYLLNKDIFYGSITGLATTDMRFTSDVFTN